MAVYNVEPFLREAVDSVIDQDIGFENVQLILVDDGSKDNSGAICDEYAKKYPDNVLVLHKENGGVSSARNLGLDHVQGELVSFLDPDDKLDTNAMSKAHRFFQKHGEETDILALPLHFFDAQTGQHTLNYKFNKGTRVIDLTEEWDCIFLAAPTSFIKSECFESLRFDEHLAISEDAHCVQKILSRKMTLGVLSDTRYWYRKRSSGEQSALQGATLNPKWYGNSVKHFQMDIIEFYRKNYSCIPKFAQFTLMYDLQWKIKQPMIPDGVLTETEKEDYFGLLHEALQFIDDEIILAQRHLTREHKIFTMQLKYGDKLHREILTNDVILQANQEVLFRVSESSVKLEFLKFEKENCILEGVLFAPTGLLDPEKCEVLVRADGVLYPTRTYGNRLPRIAWEQEIQNYLNFRVEIPLKNKRNTFSLEIICRTDGLEIPVELTHFGKLFPISNKYHHNFVYDQGWMVSVQDNLLAFKPASACSAFIKELALCCELLRTKHKIARNSVLSRILLHILKPFKRKPLWLISDRASKAGDNGEAFFRYMRNNHPEIDARFVINGDCPDYEILRQIGPVVKKDSYRHKILHLLSDCVMSSHGEDDIYNPFYRSYEPYRNLLTHVRRVFLQHGVTKDDISQWLGRFNKGFDGFVTAAIPEAASICTEKYEYTDHEVWLTGFPRFDRLYRDSQRWITVMPTWRKYLMGKLDKHTGKWTGSSDLQESDYVQFYNGLLNHPGLHAAAKQYGYQLKFLPHPNMQSFTDVFDENSVVDYLGTESEYRDIYAKSDLVVTDYSSAVFDFAYLRQPIVYTQFDRDSFFSGVHAYTKGYFDYERDGFGEVLYDLESTVECIISYMENGCQLKEMYRERIDAFFAFQDQNNCQRVYEKIVQLGNEE